MKSVLSVDFDSTELDLCWALLKILILALNIYLLVDWPAGCQTVLSFSEQWLHFRGMYMILVYLY